MIWNPGQAKEDPSLNFGDTNFGMLGDDKSRNTAEKDGNHAPAMVNKYAQAHGFSSLIV